MKRGAGLVEANKRSQLEVQAPTLLPFLPPEPEADFGSLLQVLVMLCFPLFSYAGVVGTASGMVDLKDIKPLLNRLRPSSRALMVGSVLSTKQNPSKFALLDLRWRCGGKRLDTLHGGPRANAAVSHK